MTKYFGRTSISPEQYYEAIRYLFCECCDWRRVIEINGSMVVIWWDETNSIYLSDNSLDFDTVIEYVKSSPCGCCRP